MPILDEPGPRVETDITDMRPIGRRLIDLRSDFVFPPPEHLRDAMKDAPVGAYLLENGDSDDPTVHELEHLGAKRFGKEAALFVPTVTMANLIAIMSHCTPGAQVLVDEAAHVYRHEMGGMSRLAGMLPRVVPLANAVPDIEAVAGVLANVATNEPPVRLLWVENTHTNGGGAIADPREMSALARITHPAGVAIHVDGTRIWNAAAALRVPVTELASEADSLSVSFQKGLGCPMGALLIGRHAMIEAAIPIRRMLGGSLVKAGVVAAPCIVAMETMVDRLVDDHARARRLSTFVESAGGLALEAPVVTNLVRISTRSLAPAARIQAALLQYGVLVDLLPPYTVRAVTHFAITDEDIDMVLEAFAAVIRAMSD